MGAKIPGRLKTRRPTCKCDVCGNGFISIQALRSHQACVHPKTTKRVAYKPKIEVIARRNILPVKKTMNTGNMKAKVVNVPVVRSQQVVNKADNTKPCNINTRRIEFECPVCSKMFMVYFSAYKHIQKYHCFNENGEPVTSNSSNVIQPIRIELCTACNKRVASNQVHICSTPSIEKAQASTSYTCLGCEQVFTSVEMFAIHIPGLHSDEANHFSFPDNETFTAWKADMESQTNFKYLILNKKGFTQVYHCNHMTTEDMMSHFCPSSITVQELTKEIQVTYYQEHFGHDSKVYKIPEKHKKYLIINNTEDFTVPKTKDSNELQVQFKKVINNFITSSEKIDVNSLKILLGKALEMMKVLKKCEEPTPVDLNKSITDDEITKLLDKPLRKRKADVINDTDTIAKRLRKDRDSISQKPEPEEKVVERPINKDLKTYTNTKKLVSPKIEEGKKQETQSPSSFNESYKNFVDASYKNSTDKLKGQSKPEVKKKEVVKTKVGQFKPNISNSPKENVKPIKNTKSDVIKVIKEVKFKDPYLLKMKPDFEYEVREQENDCNILIIKI